MEVPNGQIRRRAQGILPTHFIVSDDVERSRRFYTEVLGGKVVFPRDGTYVKLANSWMVINAGGGPTNDKPEVTLETARDPDPVSSFLNIRVADIEAVYAEWSVGGSVPDAAEAAPGTSSVATSVIPTVI